jgi:hypothetical protein
MNGMKQAILFLLVKFSFLTIASAQPCIPQWTGVTPSGIEPDTITNLPPAYENTPYDIVVQFKVPKVDSSIVPITVDYVELTGIDGLSAIPNSSPFIYNCNPADCKFLGDSVGCVRIQGTPTEVGTYPLVINVTVHAGLIAIPLATPGYEIVVNMPIGIDPISLSKFDVSQNSPNPVTTKTEIFVHLPSGGPISFKISNVIGNEIFKTEIDGRQGLNALWINASKYAPGIYFYTATDGRSTVTKRMIVKK